MAFKPFRLSKLVKAPTEETRIYNARISGSGICSNTHILSLRKLVVILTKGSLDPNPLFLKVGREISLVKAVETGGLF